MKDFLGKYWNEENNMKKRDFSRLLVVLSVILHGSDCLVLFFDDFNTSYSYTRIGHIEDAQGFAEVLAGGRVEVTFRSGERQAAA